MTYTVIGKVQRAYVDKTGENRVFKELYVSFAPKSDKDLIGFKTMEVRVPEAVSISDIKVGDQIRIEYDNSSRYPRVEDIYIAP